VDVQQLYEVRFKELTDKFFSSSAWPEPSAVAAECYYDEEFLLFYREMTYRHMFTRLKPQLRDQIDAWKNYIKLFDFLISTSNPEMVITAQWANDMLAEFVYQFQDFSQYRTLINARTPEEIATLQVNRDVWTLPVVTRILRGLQLAAEGSPPGHGTEPSVHALVGYFAKLESARLECLLGDYNASVRLVSAVALSDRSEPATQLLSCQTSVLYHRGLSLLLLRRYAESIGALSTLVLIVNRLLKQNGPGGSGGSGNNSSGGGSARGAVPSSVQKVMDKSLALCAIAVALSPESPIDDQVLELIDSKSPDRQRRLQTGDIAVFEDIFEKVCPKFISPAVPDYGAERATNMCQEAFRAQVTAFLADCKHQIAFLKLRSYLKLYSSIDVDKLSGLSSLSESEVIAALLTYKHRTASAAAAAGSPTPASGADEGAEADSSVPSFSDCHFFVRGKSLCIENTGGRQDRERDTDRFFIAGVRKHAEIMTDLDRMFTKYM
jgi:translation initiation factor 3 subunit L